MANSILRRPLNVPAQTTSFKTVGSALLPCTAVTEGATSFAQATAAGPMVRLLSNRDFYGDWTATTEPLLTPYASGDTAVAYVLEPGQVYQWALAAATYTFGQELTIGAAGRLTAAASTNIVVAFFRGTAGAISAGVPTDVEIANFYAKA